MLRTIFLSSFLLTLAIFNAHAQIDARMFQFPDVSKDKIVFTYGDDLWVVSKEGGAAQRLSSPKGSETMAKFSPDGKTIAFTGNYGGNTDIYTIPVTGGIPKRITWHGDSDLVLDWHPTENKILFSSRRESGRQRFRQLFEVSTNGEMPVKIPISYGDLAAYSTDGSKLAFNFHSRIFRNWKRYRGGSAPDIHVFDFNEKKSWNITNNDATNEYPMWIGDKIFYLSDQGEAKRYNIWVYDTNAKKHKQITKFTEYDIHFPAAGPDNIVFENAGKLFLLDIKTLEYKEVNINVITDQTAMIPKQVNPSDDVTWGDISPDGKRLILQARGEIFSVPAENGFTKNLTHTSGAAERYPTWSPDGKTIAWWSDETGEYQLYLYNTETDKKQSITNFDKGFRYPLFWSPDSKKIAFANQLMESFIIDVESKELSKIDVGNGSNHYGMMNFRFDWSHDSKWLTWSRSATQLKSAIFLYNVDKKEKHQVTNEFYANYSPTFDPEGKYLFCLTDRSLSPVYSDWDRTFVYPNSTLIAAIPLTNEIESPLSPENDKVEIAKDDEEDGAKDKKGKKKNKKKKDDDEEKEDNAVKIDLENFDERLVILPIKGGNYADLEAVKGKVVFQQYPNSGSGDNQSPLKYYDIKERKVETIIGDSHGFEIAANGEKLALFHNDQIGVIDIAPGQELEKTADLSNMTMMVVPKEEWKQMFWESWRLERDYFYDENMHGLDWKAIGDQYAELIDQSVSRSDVNYVLGELIAEINASHTYVGGGDMERAKNKRIGYLGIDWEKNGAYFKVKRIVKGAPWDAEVRSPLAEPGIKVNEGDYILAVNGLRLDPAKSPYAAFEDMAKETIELTVNSKPTFEGAKKVIVKTLGSETRLRHLEWIENNRKHVEEATNGRVGYIYVRSTGIDGQNELMRQFAAQFHKDGLVIDERFNSGGQIPDRFIELLNREPLAFWATRGQKDWQYPVVANFGPKVMLINGWSGSGGDAFPDYFRKAGLGKLVGTRTWGGLIGISGAPELIDGGGVTVPTFRMYNPDGSWFKEGHGVDPDIEVPENPAELAAGKDAQLDKAIEVILEELKSYKPNQGHAPYETR